MAPACSSSRTPYLRVSVALLLTAVAPQASAAEPVPAASQHAAAPKDATALAAEHRKRYVEARALYDSGKVVDAVAIWISIYKELQPSRAFRLAYNLGVAHRDHLGDITAAAEYFQTFLVEFEAHKARNELTAEETKELEPLAERTKSELSTLQMTRGRIQVNAAPVAIVARVGGLPPRISGFTAWVAPGSYTVVFGEGTPQQETRALVVAAGQLVEVTPTPPPTPKPKVITQTIVTKIVTKRPFSPVAIYVAGGLTTAAAVVTIYGYARYRQAENDKEKRVDSSHDEEILGTARTARTTAHVGLGASIVLGTITAGLVAYYFIGSKDVRETHKKPLPFIAPTPQGAVAGVSMTF